MVVYFVPYCVFLKRPRRVGSLNERDLIHKCPFFKKRKASEEASENAADAGELR